jgi:8-oxo-dGTP diphosphatase
VIADAESAELRWVPVIEVDDLPLHPGFGAAWSDLRLLLVN